MSPGMERRSLSRALSAALEYRERFKSSRWSWIASAIRANLSSGVVVLSVLVYTSGPRVEPPRSVDRGGSTQKVGTRSGLTALQAGAYAKAMTNNNTTAAAIAKLAHVYEGHMRPADALEAATTVVSGWTADRIAAYAQEAPVNTATATVHTATCTCG